MNTPNKTARLAGLLYLIVIICGTFAELFVRATLVEPGRAAATAANIAGAQGTFRLGFVSDLVMIGAFFFLPLVLYRLLHRVNRDQAAVMVLSALAAVAIMSLNMLHHFAALLIVHKGAAMSSFSHAQLQELLLFFTDLHRNGYRIAQLFFGLWLFPLGYLVYHSRMIPRIIGLLLMIACLSFLVDFFLFFLLPDYRPQVSALVTLPTVIGEFALCLWLLIKGVSTSPPPKYPAGEKTYRFIRTG